MRKGLKRLIVWTLVVCLTISLFPASAFAATNNGFTYTVNGNVVTITGYTGKGGNVTVPNTIEGKPVTALAGAAFGRFDEITALLTMSSIAQITGITFGSNMKNIPADAMQACLLLGSIHVDAANPVYTDINGVLFTKDKTRLIKYPSSKDGKDYSIPEGVTQIGDYAFSVTGLEKITLPGSLKKIGTNAFFGCEQLEEADIPAAVESIEDCAFKDCQSITGFSVDSANTHFSTDMFGVLFDYNKTKLIQYTSGNDRSSYTIPDSVTEIAAGAFYGATGLKGISIPARVSRIGDEAFTECIGFQSIGVAAANPNYTSIGGVLLNKAKTELIEYPATKSSTSYAVPGSVKKIDDYAFMAAVKLSKITVPGSVNEIGNGAFFACMTLKSVSLPKSLKKIGKNAFSICMGLQSVSIPDSVKELGAGSFLGCVELGNISIGSGLAKIDDNMFRGCGSLSSVTLPKSVRSIGKYAFASCEKLTSITIPYTVQSIDSDAFKGHGKKFTIKGYSGSYAQGFAKKNSIKFKACGKVPAYSITVKPNNAAYGTVSGAGKIKYGKNCTVKAKAKKGYVFQAWKEGGKVLSASASYTFTATRNHTLTAVFVKS